MRTLAVAIVHRDRLVAEALAVALGRSPGIAIVSADSRVPQPPKGLDAAVVDAGLPDAEMTVARLRAAGVRVVALGSGVRGDVDVPADRAIVDLADAIAPIRRRTEAGALSPREREVYDLLCQGLSNIEIGRRLFISQATAKVHVRHVYDKLGIRSRTALALNAASRSHAAPEASTTPPTSSGVDG